MMVELTETDRIEHNLAKTRARLDGHLDELQEHLTPKQMVNDAFAYFRGGDGADFTKDLLVRVKANPVPAALAGIGIAWLMVSNQSAAGTSSGPRYQDDDFEARMRVAEGAVGRFDDDDDDSYAGRLADARGKVAGVARTATDTTATYAQRIKDAVASTTHSARETLHDLKSGAGSRGADLHEGTQTMARSARDTISTVGSNPFALGAIAAVIGAVAGALIPTLDQEEAALGSAATRVRTAGRDLAQNVVDKGGNIASDTLAAVKDSADAHGLSTGKPVGELFSDVKSGDLVSNIKEVAQETLQAGKDSAQTHLGSSADANAEQHAG